MASAALSLGLLRAAEAFAGQVTLESGGSPNANETEALFKIVLYIAIVLFVAAEGVLLYMAIRYRDRHDRTPSRTQAGPALERVWLAAPVVVMIILIAITLGKLDTIKNPPGTKLAAPVRLAAGEVDTQAQASGTLPAPGERISIKVQGQRYLWRFEYPNGAISFRKLVVPVDTVVELDISSTDVVHSWWVPELGGKVAAVPGYVNRTWFKPLKTGTYDGRCAEFCGLQHATMIITIEVLSQEEWRTWAERQKVLLGEAQDELKKQRARFEQSGGANDSSE